MAKQITIQVMGMKITCEPETATSLYEILDREYQVNDLDKPLQDLMNALRDEVGEEEDDEEEDRE